MQAIKDILAELIRFESITPHDAGCQEFMLDFFQRQGFHCQRFTNPPVANFFARLGERPPLLVFAGHTDVVPVGDLKKWQTNPFILSEKEDLLYGRGSADMKGSLAAMMVMAAHLAPQKAAFQGSLGFLITSGEEGDDFAKGTPFIMAELQKQGILPTYCVVGEPSSTKQIGDVLKIGRRGSLTGRVILQGKQGHVAYPHLAENPIHRLSPVLNDLTTKQWDEGNAHFPPTSFQVTYLHAGGHVGNIIPGELELHFNFRFSTEQTVNSLKEQVMQSFHQYQLNPLIQWQLNGEPFLTTHGRLLESCIKAITGITGLIPELSTSGGTSDGRFIAPYGVEVVELGPVNATIHQVNECVSLTELSTLYQLYCSIGAQLLGIKSS